MVLSGKIAGASGRYALPNLKAAHSHSMNEVTSQPALFATSDKTLLVRSQCEFVGYPTCAEDDRNDRVRKS